MGGSLRPAAVDGPAYRCQGNTARPGSAFVSAHLRHHGPGTDRSVDNPSPVRPIHPPPPPSVGSDRRRHPDRHRDCRISAPGARNGSDEGRTRKEAGRAGPSGWPSPGHGESGSVAIHGPAAYPTSGRAHRPPTGCGDHAPSIGACAVAAGARPIVDARSVRVIPRRGDLHRPAQRSYVSRWTYDVAPADKTRVPRFRMQTSPLEGTHLPYGDPSCTASGTPAASCSSASQRSCLGISAR
jgi:hypothetical protein